MQPGIVEAIAHGPPDILECGCGFGRRQISFPARLGAERARRQGCRRSHRRQMHKTAPRLRRAEDFIHGATSFCGRWTSQAAIASAPRTSKVESKFCEAETRGFMDRPILVSVR